MDSRAQSNPKPLFECRSMVKRETDILITWTNILLFIIFTMGNYLGLSKGDLTSKVSQVTVRQGSICTDTRDLLVEAIFSQSLHGYPGHVDTHDAQGEVLKTYNRKHTKNMLI